MRAPTQDALSLRRYARHAHAHEQKDTDTREHEKTRRPGALQQMSRSSKSQMTGIKVDRANQQQSSSITIIITVDSSKSSARFSRVWSARVYQPQTLPGLWPVPLSIESADRTFTSVPDNDYAHRLCEPLLFFSFGF